MHRDNNATRSPIRIPISRGMAERDDFVEWSEAARQRLRDVLGFQIGDGTAQIMKTIIARARAGRAAVPA